MRFSNVIGLLTLGGVAAFGALVGCSSSSASGSGGSGGGAATSTSTSVSTSTSTGSGALCAPMDPSCNAVKSDCIALTDNKGKDTFALRMSQLDITKPDGLTKPLIKGVVAAGIQMNLDKCNLTGSGTFNLIMAFDKTAMKFTVGGAHPTADPAAGYTFVDEMLQGLHIAPVSGDLTIDASGKFTPKSVDGFDIVLPIYLALADKEPSVLLPLHKATISGTLSADQNCVGKYNADTLDPKSGCQPDDTHPQYTTAADLSGYMTLEEADSVVVTSIGQSLCVLISGDAGMYGDGGSPVKCKRDAAKKILFPGDWCAATNKPADAMCNDASALAGKLAASAVKSM